MGIDGGHDGGEHTSDAFSSDGDVTDGECEEVLAIDAPYQRPPRVLGPRLSVVECGTESMVRRYPSLRMRTAQLAHLDRGGARRHRCNGRSGSWSK